MVYALLPLRLALDAPRKSENALEKLQNYMKYFPCPETELANALIRN